MYEKCHDHDLVNSNPIVIEQDFFRKVSGDNGKVFNGVKYFFVLLP